MKIKPTSIKGIVAFALVAIISLQLFWLQGTYSAYQELINNRIIDNLKQAIDEEMIHRQKQLGGPTTIMLASVEDDTATVRNFTMKTADTTITFPYNKVNRYNESKANQSAFKYMIPLNIFNLDSIFIQLLLESSVPAKYTAIKIFDGDKNETKQTRKLVASPWIQKYETETIWVDLADSIGIKGYVQIPYATIFKHLLLQLFLSALLIAGVTIVLFRLSQTIFRQYKVEQIKKDFVNMMTHELKRPIISSLFAMEFLQDHAKENKPLSDNGLLDDSILALKKLDLYVEKIQEISRGENGNIELAKENVELSPFFHKLKEKYESNGEKNVSIQLQINENINLITDKIHFSNIIDNLTENSIKYSNESVSIVITVSQKNGYVYIHHRDDGWGIPPSEIQTIFDKFYRGRSSEKRRKNGLGLGLSYVKTMIEQLGGSVSVDSKEKIYTEFILTHPLWSFVPS